MSKHCSLCGTEIKEGETACSFCGTAAPDTPETPAAAPMTFLPGKTVKKHVCSGCGKEDPNGGKFCPDCGGKIGEQVFRKVVSDSAGDESEKAAVKKANPGKSAKTAGRGDTYDDWCRIGHLYQKGRCGFPLDMAKALEAYRKAASMNECRDGKYRENGYAECYLGFFYLSGNGVPQDPDTARKWFEISNACGNEHARSELVRLGCLKRPIPPKKSDPDHHRHKEKSCPEWLLPVAIMLGVIIFAILFVVLTDNLTWSRLDLIWRRF